MMTKFRWKYNGRVLGGKLEGAKGRYDQDLSYACMKPWKNKNLKSIYTKRKKNVKEFLKIQRVMCVHKHRRQVEQGGSVMASSGVTVTAVGPVLPARLWGFWLCGSPVLQCLPIRMISWSSAWDSLKLPGTWVTLTEWHCSWGCGQVNGIPT